jgi:beta-glucosidase
LDDRIWFADPIRARLDTDPVTRTRVSDAVRRILRSMYSVGLDKSPPPRTIDFDKDLAVAQRTATEGIVLLKNSGVLPIGTAVKSVLVVGGNAHLGVLAQGGWTTVAPVNQPAFVIPAHDVGSQDQRHVFFPPGPYQALKQRMPGVTVDFDTGYDPDVAAQRAASADVVIVFATRWQTQTQDAGNLDLPAGQDLLIEKVARANSSTVVVLETGNPVLMPWLSQVAGVLEAWYPGQRGAAAIAEILTGAHNPSGHLPMTFPASDKRSYPPLLARIPHASLEEINHPEGANVGYRRMEGEVAEKPLFPFGYGLSYTQFKTGGLTLDLHQGLLRARTQIENTGARPGANVVQVYLLSALGGSTRRLVGFQRVDLMPGERRSVSIPLEPRTIARWRARGWVVAKGRYGFAICSDAENCGAVTEVALSPASLKMD